MQQTAVSAISVLILDDHSLFRGGVVRLLESEPGMTVSACATVAAAMETLRQNTVDVILLDYDLGQERGSDLVPLMQEQGIAKHVQVFKVTGGGGTMGLVQQTKGKG